MRAIRESAPGLYVLAAVVVRPDEGPAPSAPAQGYVARTPASARSTSANAARSSSAAAGRPGVRGLPAGVPRHGVRCPRAARGGPSMRRGARLRSTGCPTLSGSGPWTARSCPRTSRSWTGRATPARWWSRPVPSRRPPPGKSPCRACTPLSRPHSTRAGKRDRPGPAAGSAGRCGPLLHHPACRRPGRTDLPRRPRHRTRAGRPAGPGRGGSQLDRRGGPAAIRRLHRRGANRRQGRLPIGPRHSRGRVPQPGAVPGPRRTGRPWSAGPAARRQRRPSTPRTGSTAPPGTTARASCCTACTKAAAG